MRSRSTGGACVCPDTNVLVRAAVGDDPRQAAEARRILESAASIAVTVTSLCEFVWVLQRAYRFDRPAIARSIRALVDAPNVRVDREAVAAGLRQLDRGGDFADGMIAHQGLMLGAGEMATFDRQASDRWMQDAIKVVLLPAA